MINVIWYKRSRGNWDSGLLCSIFEKNLGMFNQINELEFPEDINRAIVIVTGKPDPQELYGHLSKLAMGLVILTSEEDAYFDWRTAIPQHLETWTQYYSPITKEGIKERMLLGAPNRISKYKFDPTQPKKYLWSFVGQVQNPFRQACVEQLEKDKAKGFLQIVEYFGGEGKNGMDYQEYLNIMCQSKYVICPAGSMCVDSFRLYEAILCGAVPITDRRAPRDPKNFNYWNAVLPGHEVVYVDDWSEFLKVMEVLERYTIPASVRNRWYFRYVDELEKKLLHVAHTY